MDVPQSHRLILVRHAQSQVEPKRAPREWGLTEAGRGAARRLGAMALLDHAAGFYAGPEPKMLETLASAAAARGQTVQAEPGFAETGSEGWFDATAFTETVGRFFADPALPPALGWEPAAGAVARCAEAVARLQQRHDPVVRSGQVLPGTFAVVSGGRLLTAYLAHLLGLDAATAFARWQVLRMPDVAVIELVPGQPARVVIPFGTLGQ